ncbi:hypothetical protein Pmani_022689 [Petrolisthes manimaculis]|uniref:Uncharacterized protein n=1 Tax=Petrolisthes manimaculis TaxID=1843537 RepID=A0AAE1PDE4_9EUCA|nr:hypothetical protein Pmani_022689 [Petrolisthes manimaculis]
MRESKKQEKENNSLSIHEPLCYSSSHSSSHQPTTSLSCLLPSADFYTVLTLCPQALPAVISASHYNPHRTPSSTLDLHAL